MFRDAYLTYEDSDSLFRNWRPESDSLYELLFGALVTVFVYQLTKLILEIGLGQRRRGEILAHDLYIYMIVSGLSLSSVISGFRSRGLHKQGLSEEDETSHSASRRGRSGRGIWVLAKYLVLLMSVPSIHIAGIFLSMERETDYSFKDLDFGGLSMGLRESPFPVRMKGSSNACERVETRLGRGETEMTSFFRCHNMVREVFPFDTQDNLDGGNFVAILRSSATGVGVEIVILGKRWLSFLHLELYDGKQPYLLKNTLTSAQLSRIFENGVKRMVTFCESSVQKRDIDVSWVIPTPPDGEPKEKMRSVIVECAGFDVNFLYEIAEDMLSNVTFVETELFDVSVSPAVDEFTSADDVVFVRRRGSSVSLLVLVFMVLGVVVARIVLSLVLYNEGSFALEVILKDEFRLNCCDSMLQYEQPVYYGRHGKQDRVAKTTSSGVYSYKSSEEEWAP